jgi:hypothetical protein
MIYRLILSTFSLFSAIACQTQKIKTNAEIPPNLPSEKTTVKQADDETTPKATQNGIIYLNEGENKFLKEYGINITFKKMIEDSRCPQGKNCIWAGVATAEIEVMGMETRPATIKISTMQDAAKGYSGSENFNGYQIEMANLIPYPKANQEIKSLEGKYKIEIKIRKESTTSTGATKK